VALIGSRIISGSYRFNSPPSIMFRAYAAHEAARRGLL
jgi:hypothetical protein